MTTPSVPRCGRMDPHEPHDWKRPGRGMPYLCPGTVVHEGGARCADCGSAVCRCNEDLSHARNDEWWTE